MMPMMGARVPRDCGTSAFVASGRDHSTTCQRGAPSHGRHGTEPTRPAHSDDSGEGSSRLAEGGGLRKTFAGRNRDVSLQSPDRSHVAHSHTHGAENGSAGGLVGAQPHDPTGEADLTVGSIKKPSKTPICTSFGFMHQRLRISIILWLALCV